VIKSKINEAGKGQAKIKEEFTQEKFR